MTDQTGKPTPGPWEIVAHGGDQNPQRIIGVRGGPMIANTLHGNDQANARLIAAAPELYEALKAFKAITGAFLVSQIHGAPYSGPTLENELKQIDAALAKAGGDR